MFSMFWESKDFLFPLTLERNSPTERNIWKGNWGFITKAISSERKASDL